MWSSGDWPSIATSIQPVADQLVERMDVRDGQDVLDVGAGDGNVSIRAAERGARVTASDITPELFESGRRRAADAGVEIEWVEGDAADLPFADESFDLVHVDLRLHLRPAPPGRGRRDGASHPAGRRRRRCAPGPPRA